MKGPEFQKILQPRFTQQINNSNLKSRSTHSIRTSVSHFHTDASESTCPKLSPLSSYFPKPASLQTSILSKTSKETKTNQSLQSHKPKFWESFHFSVIISTQTVRTLQSQWLFNYVPLEFMWISQQKSCDRILRDKGQKL